VRRPVGNAGIVRCPECARSPVLAARITRYRLGGGSRSATNSRHVRIFSGCRARPRPLAWPSAPVAVTAVAPRLPSRGMAQRGRLSHPQVCQEWSTRTCTESRAPARRIAWPWPKTWLRAGPLSSTIGTVRHGRLCLAQVHDCPSGPWVTLTALEVPVPIGVGDGPGTTVRRKVFGGTDGSLRTPRTSRTHPTDQPTSKDHAAHNRNAE
jgi:hypothetical protein